MKLRKTAVALGLIAAVTWAGSSDAQIRKAGITGAAFLKIGVGARATALGSAFTTVPNDVNQMFWNPAGIALSRGETQVAYTYNSWIADLAHHAFGVARDFGDLGTFGFGVINLSLSDIASDRDAVPAFLDATYTGFRDTGTGNYDYSDLALQVSWARKFTDKLALGLTGKFISQDIDDVTASALALDAGAIYHIGYKGARVGARINNLGGDLEFYTIGAPLPLVFSVGAAIDIWEDPDGRYSVTLLSDATKPQDGEQLLFSAAEVQILDHLTLRGGYKFNYSGVDDDKIDEVTGLSVTAPRTEEGITLGAGFDFPLASYNTTLDYAFTDFGNILAFGVIILEVNLRHPLGVLLDILCRVSSAFCGPCDVKLRHDQFLVTVHPIVSIVSDRAECLLFSFRELWREL